MTVAELKQTLPGGPLLTYYGDDFTGSTDVMEAFTASGIDTVLFFSNTLPFSNQYAESANFKAEGAIYDVK